MNITLSNKPVSVTVNDQAVSVSAVNVNVSVAASGGIGPVGPAGEPGPAGASTLASLLDVGVTSLAAGDVLRYGGSKWNNYPDTQRTDGGNF